MRIIYFAVVVCCLSLFYACSTSSPPKTDLPIDIQWKNMTGSWYEIAAIPRYFRKDCHCNMHTYEILIPEMEFTIMQFCRKNGSDGPASLAKATAYVDTSEKAKLRMGFLAPFLKKDYYIFAIDPNYKWLVLGSGDRSKVSILSKERTMAEGQYQFLIESLKIHGFDHSQIERINQESCFDN